MNGMLIVDTRHDSDQTGDRVPMPAHAASLARFLGAIVVWTSGWPGAGDECTNVTGRPGDTCTCGRRDADHGDRSAAKRFHHGGRMERGL